MKYFVIPCITFSGCSILANMFFKLKVIVHTVEEYQSGANFKTNNQLSEDKKYLKFFKTDAAPHTLAIMPELEGVDEFHFRNDIKALVTHSFIGNNSPFDIFPITRDFRDCILSNYHFTLPKGLEGNPEGFGHFARGSAKAIDEFFNYYRDFFSSKHTYIRFEDIKTRPMEAALLLKSSLNGLFSIDEIYDALMSSSFKRAQAGEQRAFDQATPGLNPRPALTSGQPFKFLNPEYDKYRAELDRIYQRHQAIFEMLHYEKDPTPQTSVF